MRADAPLRRARPSLPLVGLVVAATLYAWLAPGPAWSADPPLDQARTERETAQAKLDDLLKRVTAIEAEVAAAEAELNSLTRAESKHRQAANDALKRLSDQMIAAYKHGNVDPTLALLSSGSPQEAARQVELLTMMAKRNQAEVESASSSRVRTHASASQAAQAAAVLHARQAEFDKLREQVEAEVAKAQQIEDRLAAELARITGSSRGGGGEAGPSRGSGGAAGPSAPAPVRGSTACPVGTPRHYSDTYGAPRSGGRRHKGVDILAARGTPIYAYENGTVTRMSGNALGGISLYLTGASGTLYYYTHLRGYVSGITPGTRVSAGQHIAFTGDTGNARGIPHLHWEVRPGGGANVNPYPYAKRTCD
ncbi:MAG: murein hydrolase activator EnvC family protein [Egibacteraceae bacterium]